MHQRVTYDTNPYILQLSLTSQSQKAILKMNCWVYSHRGLSGRRHSIQGKPTWIVMITTIKTIMNLLQSKLSWNCCNQIYHELVAVKSIMNLLQSKLSWTCCNQNYDELVAIRTVMNLLQSELSWTCCTLSEQNYHVVLLIYMWRIL